MDSISNPIYSEPPNMRIFSKISLSVPSKYAKIEKERPVWRKYGLFMHKSPLHCGQSLSNFRIVDNLCALNEIIPTLRWDSQKKVKIRQENSYTFLGNRLLYKKQSLKNSNSLWCQCKNMFLTDQMTRVQHILSYHNIKVLCPTRDLLL